MIERFQCTLNSRWFSTKSTTRTRIEAANKHNKCVEKVPFSYGWITQRTCSKYLSTNLSFLRNPPISAKNKQTKKSAACEEKGIPSVEKSSTEVRLQQEVLVLRLYQIKTKLYNAQLFKQRTPICLYTCINDYVLHH